MAAIPRWLALLLAATSVGAQTALAPLAWEPQGPAVWEQTDDGYRAAGTALAPGYLVSRAGYGPLRLTLEVWIAADTNSGVFVGCAPGQPISPTACFEINLWDAHPNQQARTGALVGIAPPLARVETVGRWSRLEILVEDQRLRVWIDGTLTADRLTEAIRPGHLALQFGGTGEVRFRRIRLGPA